MSSSVNLDGLLLERVTIFPARAKKKLETDNADRRVSDSRGVSKAILTRGLGR